MRTNTKDTVEQNLLEYLNSGKYKKDLNDNRVEMAETMAALSNKESQDRLDLIQGFIDMFNDKNIILTKEGEFKYTSGMAAGSLPPIGMNLNIKEIVDILKNFI